MVKAEPSDTALPIVFCLHYLGGSEREWAKVSALLETSRCIGLDLPGFGAAANVAGYSVAEMAATVERAILAYAPNRWMLAGHSMGAKVAAVIARRAEDGSDNLAGLDGLVLIAGSPPGPEPMEETQRNEMLGWFGGDAFAKRADAQRYVAGNTAAGFDATANEIAVADVLRANHDAWRAWLKHGSREDWADRIGVLQTPALLIAGADDANLGLAAQQTKMAPHFANVRIVTVAGAKHLLPLERPREIARSIDDHHNAVARRRAELTLVDNAYRELIESSRVGEKTRSALRKRDEPDDAGYAPVAMDVFALRTLRALLGRVIPQTDSMRIDLAARLDTELASGRGDGWRFAELPADVQAYRTALLSLNAAAHHEHGDDFVQLDGARQDALLTRIAGGSLQIDENVGGRRLFNAAQMRMWFEDVRADAVKAYMGHPRTLARLDYSGIANGGDGQPKSGFVRIGVAEREAWEPAGAAEYGR